MNYKIFCLDHVGADPKFWKTVQRKHCRSFWKKLAFYLAKRLEIQDDLNDPDYVWGK